MGLQLIKSLRNTSNETNFASTHLWVDASIVLNWFISDKIHAAPFIRNCVRDCKSIIFDYNIQLYYVNGCENPADYLTKSFNIKFDLCSLWLHGPKFLVKEEKCVISFWHHEFSRNNQFITRNPKQNNYDMRNELLFIRFYLNNIWINNCTIL